jgi:hypothetical protein
VTGTGPDLAGKAAGGRKLIAVVYADMVGYSRLIGLDDAGTLRRLRTLRRALIDPAIREHGGRVVQTAGDSLLVVFDSIDGAVRCAVKVQQHVPVYDGDQPPDRRIRFRIGINIGVRGGAPAHPRCHRCLLLRRQLARRPSLVGATFQEAPGSAAGWPCRRSGPWLQRAGKKLA